MPGLVEMDQNLKKSKSGKLVLNMFCFPLAGKQKKWKMFYSHMAGSLRTSMQGASGHVACVRFSFVLPSAMA